jgi:PadR family transcriptional regulator PadR
VQRNRGPSPQVVRVLLALAAEPSRWRYGYDLGAEVSLKSGSLYPILVRLADRGLLEASWEPGPTGKPPRHLYRLTAAGLDQVAGLAREPVVPRSPVRRPRLREA